MLAPFTVLQLQVPVHTHKSPSLHSVSSVIAAKRADAVAELAAKEAEYEVLLEEERQKERIQLLGEQQRKELEAQKRELERLEAEKDNSSARARFVTYNQEVEQEGSIHSTDHNTRKQQHASPQQHVSPEACSTKLGQLIPDNSHLSRIE